MTTTGDSSNQPKQTLPPAQANLGGDIGSSTNDAEVQTGATEQTDANPNMMFRSQDIGTKTARKQDVFAEHKRKDAENKAKQKITLRRAIIGGDCPKTRII